MPNVRLLADEFAKNGLHVLIPDLFDGDYVPHDLLKAIVPQESDETPGLVEAGVQKAKVAASLGPWVFKHREGQSTKAYTVVQALTVLLPLVPFLDVSKPILIKFIEAVKADSSVKKIGSVGFTYTFT